MIPVLLLLVGGGVGCAFFPLWLLLLTRWMWRRVRP